VLEEAGFELMLVNARHVKILPGRKTDVADAAWLAELLEHGLLRGSFVPPAPIRELRDLTRYRKRLIQAHAAEGQRVQKTLEDAGIKLDSVATDVLGASGRAMLAALVGGERDPQVLAELARGRLRSKLPSYAKRYGPVRGPSRPAGAPGPCPPGALGGRHRGTGPPRR
jgi:transposase